MEEGGPDIGSCTVFTSRKGDKACVNMSDVLRPVSAWYQAEEDAKAINEVCCFYGVYMSN